MELIELKPTGNQKSFYRKAMVVIDKDEESFTEIYRLFSYGTEICVVEYNRLFKSKKLRMIEYPERLSRTTRRHLNAFVRTYLL